MYVRGTGLPLSGENWKFICSFFQRGKTKGICLLPCNTQFTSQSERFVLIYRITLYYVAFYDLL